MATLYVINSHVSTNSLTHSVPRIGSEDASPVGPTSFEFLPPPEAPITISPSVGTVLPGKAGVGPAGRLGGGALLGCSARPTLGRSNAAWTAEVGVSLSLVRPKQGQGGLHGPRTWAGRGGPGSPSPRQGWQTPRARARELQPCAPGEDMQTPGSHGRGAQRAWSPAVQGGCPLSRSRAPPPRPARQSGRNQGLELPLSPPQGHPRLLELSSFASSARAAAARTPCGGQTRVVGSHRDPGGGSVTVIT